MMEKNISNNMSERLKKSFAWIFNGSRLLQTTCTSTIHFSISCSSCRSSTMMPLQKLRKEKKKKKKIKKDTACGGGGGGGEGRTCPPSSPASLPSSKKKKKKKLLSNGYGFTSSSSSDDDDDDEELGDIFSSEENDDNIWKEESEALLSSKSFSSDSSEFYQRPYTIASKKIKNIKRQQRVRRERQEENGFAVIKRSKDPYGDFRSSMVEMIVEKQIMFSGKELEKLLQSYLSLNSYHHHPVIIRAFSDIWEALFVD